MKEELTNIDKKIEGLWEIFPHITHWGTDIGMEAKDFFQSVEDAMRDIQKDTAREMVRVLEVSQWLKLDMKLDSNKLVFEMNGLPAETTEDWSAVLSNLCDKNVSNLKATYKQLTGEDYTVDNSEK